MWRSRRCASRRVAPQPCGSWSCPRDQNASALTMGSRCRRFGIGRRLAFGASARTPRKRLTPPGDDVDTGVPSHQYACAPAKAPDLTSRVSVD